MCDRGGAGWGLALDRYLRRTLAKPKRSASSSHFVLMICLLLRRARGGGRVFRLPLPTPSGLPTHPQRPGDVPLDPKEEGRSGRLAEKALYCASEELRIAFSGRQPPAAPILYARPSGAPNRAKRGGPFGPPPVNWVCTPSWFFFGAANYKRKFVINLWCYTKRLVYCAGLHPSYDAADARPARVCIMQVIK